jgi:hypothetical protein
MDLQGVFLLGSHYDYLDVLRIVAQLISARLYLENVRNKMQPFGYYVYLTTTRMEVEGEENARPLCVMKLSMSTSLSTVSMTPKFRGRKNLLLQGMTMALVWLKGCRLYRHQSFCF